MFIMVIGDGLGLMISIFFFGDAELIIPSPLLGFNTLVRDVFPIRFKSILRSDAYKCKIWVKKEQ